MAWARNGTASQQPSTEKTTQTGKQQQTGSQSQTVNESQTVRQSQASSTQNMSQTGASALDALIAALAPNAGITNEQANALPGLKALLDSTGKETTEYFSMDRIAKSTPPTSVRAVNNRPGSAIGGTTMSPGILAENQRRMQENIAVREKAIAANGGPQASGNPQLNALSLARQDAVARISQALEGYDKESAFQDAEGLMAQVLRQFQEQTMPTITRAAEGAGTSQSAVRGLFVQDAQNRAAESSAALGVKTAVDYGGISAQLMNVLEGLSSSDPIVDALVQTLGVAKGAVSNTQQSGTTRTTGSKSSQTATSEDSLSALAKQTLGGQQNILDKLLGGSKSAIEQQNIL